jgi:hypothetical protein
MEQRDAACDNNSTARHLKSTRSRQIVVSAMSLAWALILVSLIPASLVLAQNTETVHWGMYGSCYYATKRSCTPRWVRR